MKKQNIPAAQPPAVTTQAPARKLVENAHLIPHRYAQLAMQAEQRLTPVIRAQKMEPIAALNVIAAHMHFLAYGEDQHFSSQSLRVLTMIIITSWAVGLFTPSEDFPYTLPQILQVMEANPTEITYFLELAAVVSAKEAS